MTKDTDYEKLCLETEALLKRWKKAAAEETSDDLALGRTMVTHLYAANEAFQGLTEALADRSLLPEKMKELEFY